MPTLHVVKNPNQITASVLGLAYEPTLDAEGGLASQDDADGAFLLHRTGTSGGTGGVISNFDFMQWQVADAISFEVKTDTTDATPPFAYGTWIGLFSERPTSLALPADTSEFAAFRVDDTTGQVQTVTSRAGASPGVTVKGNAPLVPGRLDTFRIEFDLAAGRMRLFWPTASTLYQTHDSLSGDFLPDPTAPLGYGLRVLATSNSDRGIRWKCITVELK